MTWWLWRGCPTRSHLELGRETPQRRWYFVLRRGRVGRRQVFQAEPPEQSKTYFLFKLTAHQPNRRGAVGLSRGELTRGGQEARSGESRDRDPKSPPSGDEVEAVDL